MSEKKVVIDRLQGNIMDRDYFKVPIQHCMLLNKPCLACAKQIKGVDDIWDTMLVIVQTVVQD
jgi:hypothetical protein